MDFYPMYPGFESQESHEFFLLLLFLLFSLCVFLSLLIQCKFANSTLLSLLRLSYFITPYDSQASSAFSALICSVMRETSCCLFQMLTNLKLLKLSISSSRYPNDIFNIDNNFFDSMVNHIYPSELQLNKANASDTEASFLD